MTRLADNLREWMRREGLKQQAAAQRLGIDQPTLNRLVNPRSSKPNKNPSTATLAKISAGMGVPVDTLLNGSLDDARPIVREIQAGYQSHSASLDEGRLGVALTAIDKALRDVELQGKLGLLAEAVSFAYLEALDLSDPGDPTQRKLFDKLVAAHLGDWHGSKEIGTAARGAGKDRKAAPARAKAGSRG